MAKYEKWYDKLKWDNYGKYIFILFILVGGIAFAYYQGWIDQFFGGQAGDTETDESTFTFNNAVPDGELVSDHLYLKVYGIDESKVDDINDLTKDEVTRTSNWELLESGYADSLSVDLSVTPWVRVEIDPENSSVFESWTLLDQNNYFNYDYGKKAYHLPSDVNLQLLASDLSTVTLGTGNSSYTTDDNHTLFFEFPEDSTDELHYGDKWDVTTEDWSDMDADEKEDYRDQNNFRNWAPIYKMADDEDHDYDDPIEQYTQCPGFKFKFNQTVNSTDGSNTQVNMTVNSDYSFEQIVSGQYIYVLFTEDIHCYYGTQSIDVELQTASMTGLETVSSINQATPKDEDNLGTTTVLSTLS
jgi:hypothetical protein